MMYFVIYVTIYRAVISVRLRPQEKWLSLE